MSKTNELRDLAQKIESNYADRESIAAGFRLIAEYMDEQDKPAADLVDTAEAGTGQEA
jgi:hypothetical protein